MMFPTPPRILVARDPVDVRKGIAGLAAICEVHLGEEPLDGTLFVFSNRRRNGLKMIGLDAWGLPDAVQETGDRPIPLAVDGGRPWGHQFGRTGGAAGGNRPDACAPTVSLESAETRCP